MNQHNTNKALLYTFAKRTLDIAVAIFGIIVLSPLFLFVYVMLKRDTPGPLFFKGKRVGKGGKVFEIYKFRTMYEDQTSYDGPKLTAQNDPRVTPFGAWLRATKINEFPQLFNVLKGDMSLVGPRPEDPELAKEWHPEVREALISVRPGITSPASVIYRNLETLLQSDRVIDEYLQSVLPTKMRLDMLYVRNRSILTDLDVLLWTAIALLPNIRKTKITESRLYWGPIAQFATTHFRWFIIDFFVTLICYFLVGLGWRAITPLNIGWSWAPFIAFGMAIVFGLSNSIMGLNNIFWSKAHSSEAVELALSSVVSIGLLLLINRFVITQPAVPTGLFLAGGLTAFFGFVIVRYRERIVTGFAHRWLGRRTNWQSFGERVLIVGAGELGEFAIWLVRKGDLARAFYIVGMVDDDPRKYGMRIDGVPVIGSTEDLAEIAARENIGVILFAISNIRPENRERILEECSRVPCKLVMIPNVVAMMRAYFSPDSATLTLNTIGPDLIPAAVIDAWLGEAESLLAEGDVESARALLGRLRAEIIQPDLLEKEHAITD